MSGLVTAQDLHGCWMLEAAIETRGGADRPNPVIGGQPTGFLHYLAGDRVAVTLALEGRKPLSTPHNRRIAPEAELAAAARTFDAYAGTFSLAPGRITHHVEVSTFQNEVGTDLVRELDLAGDVLTLSLPPMVDGGEPVRRRLVWKRLTAG